MEQSEEIKGDAPRQQQPLSPNTTHQEDVTKAGQRQINLIWEITQSILAIIVIVVSLGATTYGYINRLPDPPNLLAVGFGAIIGFYYARTNHQAIGGIGPKANENQEYLGR